MKKQGLVDYNDWEYALPGEKRHADIPEKVLALEDPSATLIFEANHLDRCGPDSLSR